MRWWHYPWKRLVTVEYKYFLTGTLVRPRWPSIHIPTLYCPHRRAHERTDNNEGNDNNEQEHLRVWCSDMIMIWRHCPVPPDCVLCVWLVVVVISSWYNTNVPFRLTLLNVKNRKKSACAAAGRRSRRCGGTGTMGGNSYVSWLGGNS